MAGRARSLAWIVWLGCLCGGAAQAAALVQLTNVSDFSLPAWSLGNPAPTAHIDLCVYAAGNLVTGGYSVTATGSNGFVLNSGANQLPYALYWEDDGAGNLGNNGGTQLTSGAALGSQLNASLLSATCALGVTGPNARLNLKINQADMTAALAGTYTGTVTLLIAPN